MRQPDENLAKIILIIQITIGAIGAIGFSRTYMLRG
jgi:preprotein translocase subunit Sss1